MSSVSLRVPLIVAFLMIIISVVISDRVLTRLSHIQEENLQGLVDSYLDGVSASIMPSVMRGDIWEVFDVLDRSGSNYASLDLIETVVTGANEEVIASNDPKSRPSYSPLPPDFLEQFASPQITVVPETMKGFAMRNLVYQNRQVGKIYTVLDVSKLMAERRNVLYTLLVTNGILACVFAAGGFWLVSFMIRPMRILENHMRESAGGMLSLIDIAQIPKGDHEVSNLFRRFNELVQSEQEQRQMARRLAEEEKLASLGRLSSSMAHEINNPLGGLFNAIDTLKTHGTKPGVREASLALIERGLIGIRDVVKATLATYKYERSPNRLTRDDLQDVHVLAMPEITRKRQKLLWDIEFDEVFSVPAGPIRQAALNLMLNAVAVTPEMGTIVFEVKSTADYLHIEVADEGMGMSPEIAATLKNLDSRSDVGPGQGIGLWVVRQVLIELHGRAIVAPEPSGGTRIRLEFYRKGIASDANAA